jgi:4-diphosphocytidyl-2-C-methyl-D-erythritol kinase
MAVLKAARNDLEAPARRLHPEIGACLEALGALPGAVLARMSGSGGTCFALFETEARAAEAAEALAQAQPGWWIRATRFHGTPKGGDV